MKIKNTLNYDLFIDQIDKHINSISKLSIDSETMYWFQQSTLHWMMGLFIMRYFYLNHDLSKQQLIEEINKHITNNGKRTITTEFRYIDECENKNFITTNYSSTDQRKKVVKPTQLMLNSFRRWFEEHSIYHN